MSIFSSKSSPTLSHHSAWWISSLSDLLSPLSFSFHPPNHPSLAPSRSLSFMAYSCAATQALDGGSAGWGWGDGRWLVCTFSSKLKYSCMCACVAVWVRLHVYPSLVFVCLQYVRLFMSAVWGGQLNVQGSACWYVYFCVCVCEWVCYVFYQVMREALSFDFAPKIRLGTSITHELLCTRSQERPRRRN